MKFPSLKKAKLSAVALAKSFKLTGSDARHLLAESFNEKSWANFCLRLSAVEPQVTSGEVYNIVEILTSRIAARLSLEPSRQLKAVIESAHPYQSKPKSLRFDVELNQSFQQNSSDDSIDLAAMMDMLDDNGGMDSMLEKLADSMAESGDAEAVEFASQMKDLGSKEFMAKMRISKPVDPWLYNMAIDSILSWETTDESEDFQHGVPLFHWFDEHQEEQPVFINSISTVPGDTADEMFFQVLEIIGEGYESDFEKPMLLFGNPNFKKINGETFCIIGVWYDGHDWRWLFLSKLKPWEQAKLYPQGTLDNLENSLEQPAPPVELAICNDDGNPAHLVYSCTTSPMEVPVETDNGISFKIGSRPVITGVGGWESFI